MRTSTKNYRTKVYVQARYEGPTGNEEQRQSSCCPWILFFASDLLVYILDKYLSIMFGRPRLLHDEDIDQELPDETNDEAPVLDMSTRYSRLWPATSCVIPVQSQSALSCQMSTRIKVSAGMQHRNTCLLSSQGRPDWKPSRPGWANASMSTRYSRLWPATSCVIPVQSQSALSCQMSTSIRWPLHRKLPAKASNNGCSYLELELRKRIFWSVYILEPAFVGP
jgi:hypothetical protein